jgi:hypothetical protein
MRDANYSGALPHSGSDTQQGAAAHANLQTDQMVPALATFHARIGPRIRDRDCTSRKLRNAHAPAINNTNIILFAGKSTGYRISLDRFSFLSRKGGDGCLLDTWSYPPGSFSIALSFSHPLPWLMQGLWKCRETCGYTKKLMGLASLRRGEHLIAFDGNTNGVDLWITDCFLTTKLFA